MSAEPTTPEGAAAAGPGVVARSGVVGGGCVEVAPSGCLGAPDGSWSLEWWIGADDRWHHPALATAVRQELLDGMPVFETRLRVPGGDALQRVYGARLGGVGGGDHLVVEVLNESRLPFAVALALGPLTRAVLVGSTLAGDGRVALRWARAPSRWARARQLEGLFDLVAHGGSCELTAEPPGGRSDPGAPGRLLGTDADGVADGAVALLWPVAHGAGLRVLVPLDSPPAQTPVATGLTGTAAAATAWPDLPGAAQVARGWRRHLDAASRVLLPDDGLKATVDESRAQVLIEVTVAGRDASHLARLVATLAAWGHDDEARVGLGRLSQLATGDAAPSTQAAFLTALAAYRRLTGDRDVAAVALDEVARAAAVVSGTSKGRSPWRAVSGAAGSPPPPLLRQGVLAAAELLEAAGERAAAQAVRGRGVAAGSPAAFEASTEDLARTDAAAPSGRGDPLALLGWVHGALVAASTSTSTSVGGTRPGQDGPGGATAQVTLAPGWREAWRGQPLEVHGVRSAVGRISYALRWHGDRPALLWDIEPSPLLPLEAEPFLEVPALALGWQARSWRGETLLSAPAG